MDPRVAFLSAFRNLRAPVRAVQPPSVPSPVGATTSTTTAGQQAAALKKRSQEPAQGGVWGTMPAAAQQELQGEYGRGGFDAVKNIPGWFDLPEHVRTQILTGMRG